MFQSVLRLWLTVSEKKIHWKPIRNSKSQNFRCWDKYQQPFLSALTVTSISRKNLQQDNTMKSKKYGKEEFGFLFNWFLVTGISMPILFTFTLYLDSQLFSTLLSRITLYPNITTVLNILLTKPVSTATSEFFPTITKHLAGWSAVAYALAPIVLCKQ